MLITPSKNVTAATWLIASVETAIELWALLALRAAGVCCGWVL